GFGAGAAASEENQRHRPPWTAGFWESKSLPGKCEETILKDGLFAFYCVKTPGKKGLGSVPPVRATHSSDDRKLSVCPILSTGQYRLRRSVILWGIRLGRRPSADERFFEGLRLRRKCPPDTFVMDTFVYRTRKFEYPPGLIRKHQVVVSG
ncbi:hypothetical protein, partial [Desulfitobacterium sp.]|uniref:hypothetical protein n=1 Tax=Desulfitobacterium sp. TaxID=49981 RepID=UPI002CD3A2E8